MALWGQSGEVLYVKKLIVLQSWANIASESSTSYQTPKRQESTTPDQWHTTDGQSKFSQDCKVIIKIRLHYHHQPATIKPMYATKDEHKTGSYTDDTPVKMNNAMLLQIRRNT